MIEIRWKERAFQVGSDMVHMERILQYRTLQNPLEMGLHAPIYSDWTDVPYIKEGEL